jgi:hypothetical protein
MSQWLTLVYIKVVTGDGVDEAQDGVDKSYNSYVSYNSYKKILVKGIMCFWLKKTSSV